jgi:hypothetical protein
MTVVNVVRNFCRAVREVPALNPIQGETPAARVARIKYHSETYVDPYVDPVKNPSLHQRLSNFLRNTFFHSSAQVENSQTATKDRVDGDIIKGNGKTKVNGFMGFGGQEIKEGETDKIQNHVQKEIPHELWWGPDGVIGKAANKFYMLQAGLGILGSLWGLLTAPDKGNQFVGLLEGGLQFLMNFGPLQQLGFGQQMIINLALGNFLDPLLRNIFGFMNQGGNPQQERMMQLAMAQQQMVQQIPNYSGNGLTTQQQMAYA